MDADNIIVVTDAASDQERESLNEPHTPATDVMSGGSMEYLYSKLEEVRFPLSTPLRKVFAEHLKLVTKALHDIEWVDSGDYIVGDEDDAIRACLKPAAILRQVIVDAEKARVGLEQAIREAKLTHE